MESGLGAKRSAKRVLFAGSDCRLHAILPFTQNEAGIARVLGREIPHATSRHGAQRIFQQNAIRSPARRAGTTTTCHRKVYAG